MKKKRILCVDKIYWLRIASPSVVFSDLAPSDYWLFADLKKMLQGKRFDSNDEVIAATESILKLKINRSTHMV